MSRVYVKFPKTGLGNMLLVWARAAVFARLNHLPLVIAPWWGIRWGAWKRNEKKKRLYWGYFRESSVVARAGIIWRRFFNQVVTEPCLQNISQEESRKKLFVFQQVVVRHDLFDGLREHREWIKEQLWQLINPALKLRLGSYEPPEIAVHIRRGDFKLGNPVTPQGFFVAAIEQARAAFRTCLEVIVFTDADEQEIAEVLALPNIRLADAKPDILDILLMSRARVIVLSQSSTFSYWAAFLSDAIIIKPAGDWQKTIRERNDRNELPFNNSLEGRQQLATRLNDLIEASEC